jgi:hypothetical protein
MASKNKVYVTKAHCFETWKDYDTTFKLKLPSGNTCEFKTTIRGSLLDRYGIKKAIQLTADELGYENYYAHIDELSRRSHETT